MRIYISKEVREAVEKAKRRYSKYGFDSQLESLQKAIIKTHNVDDIIFFAENIPEADIERLEDEIISIASKDKFYSYGISDFVFYVKQCNVDKLQDAVLKFGNAYALLEFAQYVSSANIELLQEAILKTNDIKRIYEFAKNVPNADIKSLEDAIVKSKNYDFIISFAEDVKDANISRLEDIIIETKDCLLYSIFVTQVKSANIEKFANAIQYMEYNYVIGDIKGIINKERRKKEKEQDVDLTEEINQIRC